MRKILYLLTIVSLFTFIACSEEDEILIPDVEIENVSELTSIAQGDTVYLKAKINTVQPSSFTWAVNGEKAESTDLTFVFVPAEVGKHVVTLTCSNNAGEAFAALEIDVYGKYKYGTYVLNEGNMTSETGSLIFISPKGVVTDSAYWRVNGRHLGNVCQDLFIADNKIYIISQNGGTSAVGTAYECEGFLAVANAETLKREAAYNDELSTLSWPTHIAVMGNEAFIRDNSGVHSFNTSTKKLTLINGTSGALKNRMAVAGGKVFVPANRAVLVLEAGKSEVSHKITFDATVSGVIKTSDGNIYVSTTGTPNKITKIKVSDYSVIKTSEVTVGSLGAGWGATPGISAKGDTIYYGNASINIYRHIFTTGTSELLVKASDYVSEDAGMAYNNLAVHPVTGEVYQTTIKGYGLDYLKNNISVFNFSQSQPELTANYKHYTHFPAGIFFTYDF